jgi:hypothetical protein
MAEVGLLPLARVALEGATQVLLSREVCTFSDGTGKFAGFHARVNVSTSDPHFINYNWDGTYGFSSEHEREN